MKPLRVVLFGATGMVGQGVLRECLADPDVERVLVVGRTTLGVRHEKLEEVLHRDFFDFSALEAKLAGWDACFFCLGVSSAGKSEAEYRRLTHDIALSAAGTFVGLNPSMTFVYVSGAGTDSSERGRSMWARVKGKTENDLSKLPFQAVFLFRPAIILPGRGIRSKTGWYRILYALLRPLSPLLYALLPGSVTTTEEVGRAMLEVARRGAPKRILESRDIRELGGVKK